MCPEGNDATIIEPDAELDELARQVIGAAIEVHRQLGPGLDEALYENALCVELTLRNIAFVQQVVVDVSYKDHRVGQKRIDLLISNRLVVELKAVESLTALHKAQVLTYLKITRNKLGLLINFNATVLREGIKRIVNPYFTLAS